MESPKFLKPALKTGYPSRRPRPTALPGEHANSTPLSGAFQPIGVQVVGYETAAGDGVAALLIADDEQHVEREPLEPDADLTYTLGERHCAGVTTDDGHVRCEAESAPYCQEHTGRWPCARCTGDCDLPIDSCREEHAVYLAAFAPSTFKVGVTRHWRLETRLREQGADRAAHARTVADGRVARTLEGEWAERRELTDRVRVPEKISGLHATVDADAWGDLLSDFTVESTVSFDYGLELADRPVPETLASGTIRGTKGRVLVLDGPGGTYAVDMRDLVGHELQTGRTDRDLQSSLGAF